MADIETLLRLSNRPLPGSEHMSLAMAALVPPDLPDAELNMASRAEVAWALNVALFADLLQRVPSATRYVSHTVAQGQVIHFDHGALRTIEGATGALPSGHGAFARILEPLGYAVAGLYPLPRLSMTGRAFRHRDLPETIPQFFVSELHVAHLDPEAQAAAEHVFGGSNDPLGKAERRLLDTLQTKGAASLDLVGNGLPGLVDAFGAHHPLPSLADYETLRRHSPEAAWIATEGNAFNHATDRVDDIEAVTAALRAQGFALKPDIEVSASGRVRQTAFVADRVERSFVMDNGSIGTRLVPGSFYEFISRDVDTATGRLDLSFDSGNATGIFSVTSAR